jgi:hypothetical protein
MTSASILIPSKFIIIITHFLVCLVIFQTKEENVYASLPDNIDPNSDRYKAVDSSIQTAIVLTLIFVILEIFILFTGVTMFYDKFNIV